MACIGDDYGSLAYSQATRIFNLYQNIVSKVLRGNYKVFLPKFRSFSEHYLLSRFALWNFMVRQFDNWKKFLVESLTLFKVLPVFYRSFFLLSYLFIYSNFVLFLWRKQSYERLRLCGFCSCFIIFFFQKMILGFSAKPHTLEHTTMEERTHYFGHLTLSGIVV